MKRIWSRSELYRALPVAVAILTIIGGIASAFVYVAPTLAAGGRYYVAPSSSGGSDRNPGTLRAPFATIQKCASVAGAGDTCSIRGGTYRETIRPQSGQENAPVIFEAYQGEQVTVSGADEVVNWSQHEGSLYKSSAQNWDLGLGNNQVFVDGVMVNEARWPNMAPLEDPSHPSLARVQSGSYTGEQAEAVGTINDTTLPSGLEGAKVNAALGDGYLMQTGSILTSEAGHITFQYDRFDNYVEPDSEQVYFVWGKLSLLDTANESFYDSASSTLYLQTSQGDHPKKHTVETKKRLYAFDLRDQSFVTIKGINIFAATIVTSESSTGNVIDGISSRYPTHAFNITGAPWTFLMYDSGIVLAGSNNTLKNSVVEYSSANGVSLSGQHQQVVNNVIHDVNYAATDASTVTTGISWGSVVSRGHIISHNTLYNSGRSVLIHRGSTQIQITHNDIYNAGLQVEDLGVTYTWGSDGAGSVIAYNLVHDNLSERYGGMGIYLDNNSHNFTVHHNVVWNVGTALNLNKPSTNNKIYNNTLFGSRDSIGSGFDGDTTGTEIKNNIFAHNVSGIPDTVVQENNIGADVDPKFVDVAARNYSLQGDSPAIDAGQVIQPYTDGFVGSAPDIGAYEYGAESWLAGADHGRRWAPNLTEAESYDQQHGIISSGGVLSDLDRGDWVRYNNVDFGQGVVQFQAHVAVPDATAGQQIDVYIDKPHGKPVGTLTLTTTSDANTFAVQRTSIKQVSGKHDVYLVFKGGNASGSLDWIQFSRSVTREASAGFEAEQYDDQHGVKQSVTDIRKLDEGDWVRYSGVDFGTGAGVNRLLAHIDVPQESAGKQIEVRLDGVNGILIGTLTVQATNRETTIQRAELLTVVGKHDVYLVFKGDDLGKLDRVQFIHVINVRDVIQAENYDELQGVIDYGTFLGGLDNSDWLKYANADFGNGVSEFSASIGVPDQYAGQQIEVRIDSVDGTLLGTLTVQSTGDWLSFATQTTSINSVTGIHDLYLVFKPYEGVGALDWIQFA